ncbi:MAG: 4-hydroxy-tetrahydrodipicolinate synthase [Victivallales bacterium]|nr:4-hydroxy-tetrahydrodipicolinate synthase [Victivallales bacterium]MCF7889280.1 4-hydroxy-tetrahydrodipicolinate synthase [Victivallales bacterium]
MQIQGVNTALITPFNNGEVDFNKVDELIDMQLEAGVEGLVPMGTTGESPTLSTDEHLKLIGNVISRVDGRCKVIAGTGSNSTFEAIHQTKIAKSMGADACLQVTPYYNKPTQEGLYSHFSKVADIGLPVVLYNVPGRAGVPIAVDTIARLGKHPNIVAVKEAGGSVERVSMILDVCDITVLSGDDALTLPMMSVGAKGVISVLANFCPRAMKEITDSFLAGDWAKAQEVHRKYYRLMRGMFIETNPISVKTAMAVRGIIEEEYRLPMSPMAPENREKLIKIMEFAGC